MKLKIREENGTNKKNAQVNLAFFYFELFNRDLGRIQTCNRLSRNQVFYSVELRGLLSPYRGCKYNLFFKIVQYRHQESLGELLYLDFQKFEKMVLGLTTQSSRERHVIYAL